MADPPATASKGGTGLTRKVGPFPVWLWAALGFGAYYLYTHYGKGASSSAGKVTPPGGRSITVGNITLTQSGRGGRGGGGGRDVDRAGRDRDKTGGDKDQAHKCPEGFFWDPDDNDHKGGCVKIKGHKGPDKPGSDNATARGATQRRGPGTGGPPTRQPRDHDQMTDRDRTTTAGGQGAGGSQSVMIGGAPTGGPVNAQTGQPVFEEWQHAHRGPQVPPPVEAYAPQTSGAVYGPAAVDLAAQSAG